MYIVHDNGFIRYGAYGLKTIILIMYYFILITQKLQVWILIFIFNIYSTKGHNMSFIIPWMHEDTILQLHNMLGELSCTYKAKIYTYYTI